MSTITVRELLAMDCDIDVCDDVDESLYIAFIGPQVLTDVGEVEHARALDLLVSMPDDDRDCAIIRVDHAEEREWRKNLRAARHLFHSAAGYCSEAEYDAWFAKGERV